jgi:hypothetical protein
MRQWGVSSSIASKQGRLERGLSLAYWVVTIVLTLGLTGPFAVLAVVLDAADERIFSLAAALVMAVVTPSGFLAMAWMQTRLKRPSWVLGRIDGLQARLGGTAHLPTMRELAVQPRLETVIDGTSVHIVLLRQGAQHSSIWMLLVSIAEPISFRLAVSSWRAALAPRGALVGLKKHEIGDPTLDGSLHFLSDDADRAKSLLRDPDLRRRWLPLMQMEGRPLLNLSPASALADGVTFRVGVSEQTSVDEMESLVRSLLELGRAARAR